MQAVNIRIKSTSARTSHPFARLGIAAIIAAGSATAACSSDANIDNNTQFVDSGAGANDATNEAVKEAATDAAPDVSTEAGDADAGPPPVISNLAIISNPKNVLSATITFTTDVPTKSKVVLTNTGDGGNDNIITIGPAADLVTAHSIIVLGMRAASTFDIQVTAADAASRTATSKVTYTSGQLPAIIPPIQVVTNDPAKTSPGFTLMTIWRWDRNPAIINPKYSSIVALDPHGQVVWYYIQENPGATSYPGDPKKLPNGDLMITVGDEGWAEIDMMGNVVRSRTADDMGLDSIHHEITQEGDAGAFVALSTELRQISGVPVGDAGATTTYPVVGDVFAEFDSDGGVHNRWSAFDLLDPTRINDPTMFNAPFWNGHYPDAGATKDWTHGNSVIVDPNDGELVASSRTQSWVYKFGRNDGGTPQLRWRLGAGGDFALTNANETFQYGQHALSILPNGHLMLFDDGNNRPLVDGGPTTPNSRAVEYELDTVNMKATIAWQYQETPPFYSQFVGSAYLLPNGNVLICDGGEVDGNQPPNSTTGLKFARIMEVTHDANPTKVLEYKVREELNTHAEDATFSGYTVYRATRIPSLY